MWWAGITAKDAATALEGARQHLIREVIAGHAYWLAAPHGALRSARSKRVPAPLVKLLPAYDEYTVAYQDRSLLVGPGRSTITGFGLLNPVVVVGGLVVGSWKRTIAKGSVNIRMKLRRALSRPEKEALQMAVAGFREFLDIETKKDAQPRRRAS